MDYFHESTSLKRNLPIISPSWASFQQISAAFQPGLKPANSWIMFTQYEISAAFQPGLNLERSLVGTGKFEDLLETFVPDDRRGLQVKQSMRSLSNFPVPSWRCYCVNTTQNNIHLCQIIYICKDRIINID